VSATRGRNEKTNAKGFLILGVPPFFALLGAVAVSEERPVQHIQIAEIEVNPAQLDSYKAAVTEQIEAAIRLEPSVLVLYSMSNKDNPHMSPCSRFIVTAKLTSLISRHLTS
jgi:hypothetical protein